MDIYDYLNSLPREKLHYFPNPGNAGDALIAQATYQIFKKNNLDYRIVSEQDHLDDSIVVYAGGGNLVNYYSTGSKFIEKIHGRVKKLIILPHTITNNEKLLKGFGDNVEILCRERTTYSYVREITSRPNVFLMDDLAFYLDIHEVLRIKPAFLPRPQPGIHWYIKSFKRFIRKYAGLSSYVARKRVSGLLSPQSEGPGNAKVLNCFREDIERTDRKNPLDNIDIASVLAGIDTFELTSHRAAYRLLRYLRPYDVINTNRLHVCIAGILLKKKVNFYPNVYHKNKSVYEYSIQGKYPNVKWMGS